MSPIRSRRLAALPPERMKAAVKSWTSAMYFFFGLLLFDSETEGLEILFEILFKLSENEQAVVVSASIAAAAAKEMRLKEMRFIKKSPEGRSSDRLFVS